MSDINHAVKANDILKKELKEKVEEVEATKLLNYKLKDGNMKLFLKKNHF